MKIKILTFLFLINIPYAWAQNSIYQECSPDDFFTQKLENHMNRFLTTFDLPERESQFPENTLSSHIVENILNQDYSSLIDKNFSYIRPICFYASSLRGKRNFNQAEQLYYCESEEDSAPQSQHNNTGPCLSQNYIQKLSSTFDQMSQCFNLSDYDSNILFEILNHESAFIPNAKSPSKARCIGQLRRDTIIELTAQLSIEMYDRNKFDHISNNLNFDNCPYLNELTIPANLETSVLPQALQMGGVSLYDNIKTIIRNQSITCKIVSNPVRCLLYSFLYYKNTLNHFNKIFEPQEGTFLPQELLEDSNFNFKNRLNLNELIIYQNNSLEMVFISTKGAYENGYKKNPSGLLQKVEIIDTLPRRETQTSDMEQFKKLVLRLSYNGGVVVSQFLAQEFLFELKRNIANPYSIGLYKRFRERILNGQTVPFKELISLFHSYIQSESSEVRANWNQIKQYSAKIDRDINYMNIQEGTNQNPIQQHFKELKEEEIGGALPLDWMGTFNQQVQNSCHQFNPLQ